MTSKDSVALAASRDAPLPAKYEAAKSALAVCVSVDECSTWAKKAAALASYARQANDASLEEMAARIRARAIRRAGVLLKELPAKAGRRGSGPGGDAAPHLDTSTRAAAARAAGLSPDQTKDMLRVARVPEADFEDAVEGKRPATIPELAEMGTRRRTVPLIDLEGRDPAAFNRSLYLAGDINDLAESIRRVTPKDFAAGCLPRHLPKLIASIKDLSAWLSAITKEMKP